MTFNYCPHCGGSLNYDEIIPPPTEEINDIDKKVVYKTTSMAIYNTKEALDKASDGFRKHTIT